MSWNCFFADIAVPATRNGEHEIAFADDVYVFTYFDRSATDESIHAELATTRRRVHKWGKLHRVDFDPGKEHLFIIHPAFGDGQVFKLLGITCDIFCVWKTTSTTSYHVADRRFAPFYEPAIFIANTNW